MFSDLSCLYLSPLTPVQSRLCWQLSSCSPSLLLLHFHNATRSWPHGELWARAPYDIDLAEAEGGTQGRRSPREAWLQFNHWMFEGSSLSCDTFIHEVPSFSSTHPCFTGWDKALSLGWGQGDMASSEGSAPPPAATSSSRCSPSTPEVLRFISWTTPGCRRIFLFYSLMLNGCAQS